MKIAFLQISLAVLCLSAQAQKVSNILAEQRGQEIVVFYSLDTNSPCEVSLLLSQDNGSTWGRPLKNVSGDVGKNISAGEKQIIWKVLEEREQLVGAKIKFKLVVSEIEKIMTQEELNQGKNKRRKVWSDVAAGLFLSTISVIIITATGQ